MRDDNRVVPRTIVRMPRLTRTAAALALALLATPILDASAGWNEARAETVDVSVGTELLALSDVNLHQAEILKGSRVSVTKLLLRQGKLQGVSVALADGHVVKVTMGMLRSFFRVVSE